MTTHFIARFNVHTHTHTHTLLTFLTHTHTQRERERERYIHKQTVKSEGKNETGIKLKKGQLIKYVGADLNLFENLSSMYVFHK